ncbi:M20 family metallo-hydrolase [Azospirillum sp. RWY-5-1]|uniref:M20 family metallo-hydrolase n=1 Tax=Azospirillum oleiclasticum TaxID=2735135 RepID=A0ABX2T6N7_9PROT|nr:M20 family metallo-hydrolase [Azospirillum oleiclasticum]NYZ12835.1 M20 family metallo-hydrolase [Azospirillum oleiclasticum]NYZ19995.1 M20 family metallo-hydrolase [Azospirillum oleiclasticum]
MATSRASAFVDKDRLWRRHAAMAAFGAIPGNGVNRAALSAEDIEARRTFVAWGAERGYAAFTDAIGNLFLRRPGRDPAAAPVLTGSHLDSQPRGGRFDGTYGVLAGLEALEALDDAGIATERPIEVVSWTNEEGSRFQPGTMGSVAFIGLRSPADFADVRDAAGVPFTAELARALAALPQATPRPFGWPVHAFVEAHIEQGPVLYDRGETIGAVDSIQGARWFQVELRGETSHAGTTPLAARRDAVQAAVRCIAGLNDLMHDPADVLRFTVGRVDVEPNVPNSVASRAAFTIDLRHPEATVLAARGERIAEVCRAAAGACAVAVSETLSMPPCRFDAGIVDRVEHHAQALGLPVRRMPSGAFHDAGYMAGFCPTAMIFIPCERGISHNEAENATPDDLAAGARVLAEVLVDLAG